MQSIVLQSPVHFRSRCLRYARSFHNSVADQYQKVVHVIWFEVCQEIDLRKEITYENREIDNSIKYNRINLRNSKLEMCKRNKE